MLSHKKSGINYIDNIHCLKKRHWSSTL